MVFSQSKWEIQFNNFIPTGIYLLKVNSRNTRRSCEISSKLTINIPEQRQRRSDVALNKIKYFSFDIQNPFNLVPKIYPKTNQLMRLLTIQMAGNKL